MPGQRLWRRAMGGPAADMAHAIVVGEGPARPAIGRFGKKTLDIAADMASGERRPQQFETIGHMEPVGAGGVFGHEVERLIPIFANLAHDHPVGIRVGQRAEALEKAERLWPVFVVDVVLKAIGLPRMGPCLGGGGWVCAQLWVVHVEICDIKPEAIDAAVEPKADLAQERLLDVGVPEVEIGLLDQEVVEVVLAATRFPLPARTAKAGEPIIGRRAVFLRICPDIPIGLWIVA